MCNKTKKEARRVNDQLVFIQDDSDDDLNDEDIPGFGAGPGTPLLATPDKGKGRAAERVASPGPPPPVVSGNIAVPGNASRGSSTRQSFGGMQVETRYARDCSHPMQLFSSDFLSSYGEVDTLDEPITATIVS